MQRAVENFSLPPERVFTDYRQCIEKTKPDIVLLCPATARHAEWVLKVAPYGVHVLLEKPFAASLADADLHDRGHAREPESSLPSTGRWRGTRPT